MRSCTSAKAVSASRSVSSVQLSTFAHVPASPRLPSGEPLPGRLCCSFLLDSPSQSSLRPHALIYCRINHLLTFSTLHNCFAAVGYNCLSTGPSHLFTSAIADRLDLSGTSNPVVLYGRTRPEQVISSIAHLLYLLDPPRRLVPAL